MSAEQTETFRWAIVGSSGVARQFAYSLSTMPGAGRVTALVARDPTRTELAAKAIGASVWSTDFSECLDMEVDAVYLAVPLGQHEELATEALRAGKATLVEKPLALDSSAARRIEETSRSTGVFCMEAMWPRFLPVYEELKHKIAAGDLGEVRQFSASFSGAMLIDPEYGVFDSKQRGGALMHRACYGISMARFLAGPMSCVKAVGRISEGGADATAALVLSHENGAVSTISASYETTNTDRVTVAGTRATATLLPSIYRPTQGYIEPTNPNKIQRNIPGNERRKSGIAWNWLRDHAEPLRALRRKRNRLRSGVRAYGYGYQAAEVVRCVRNGQVNSEVMPLSESIEIAEILDDAYAQMQNVDQP